VRQCALPVLLFAASLISLANPGAGVAAGEAAGEAAVALAASIAAARAAADGRWALLAVPKSLRVWAAAAKHDDHSRLGCGVHACMHACMHVPAVFEELSLHDILV